MQDEHGQVIEAESISAGLDYPGIGPEHAHLAEIGRARYVAVTDDEVLDAFQVIARTEGIIAALVSCHALAWVLRAKEELAGKTVILNLRSEEHTSELQSLMRISYAVFCLKKKKKKQTKQWRTT